jgi:hypothetical protein
MFCILKVTEDGTDPHPYLDPDPLVRGADLRIRIGIRIRIKMSRIRNTTGNSTSFRRLMF